MSPGVLHYSAESDTNGRGLTTTRMSLYRQNSSYDSVRRILTPRHKINLNNVNSVPSTQKTVRVH